MKTTAVRKGDKYILNGRKCFITNGGVALLYAVFATVDKTKAGYPQPKDEVVGVSCQLSVVSTGGYFEI